MCMRLVYGLIMQKREQMKAVRLSASAEGVHLLRYIANEINSLANVLADSIGRRERVAIDEV